MSFMKEKDLDTMLRAAEEGHALDSPMTDWEIAVSQEGIRRARETIRLAKIGLDLDDKITALNGLIRKISVGDLNDDEVKDLMKIANTLTVLMLRAAKQQ